MHAPRASRDGSGAVAHSGADPGRVLLRAGVWLVWTAAGVGVTLGVLALVYGALNYDSLTEVLTGVAGQALWAMSFPLVGAVIATHRPRNPLGWMFLVIGLSQGLTSFSGLYASYRPIVWIIKWMIKAHPTKYRMPRQADLPRSHI
jgi:hypothetical protein